MNKHRLILFFLILSGFSFSQEKSTLTTTTKIGVNVYQSNGVEGKVNKQSDLSRIKQIPVSEYNITQCENAIQDINDKINHLIGGVGTEERILKYRNAIIILENRLNEIKLNKEKS